MIPRRNTIFTGSKTGLNKKTNSTNNLVFPFIQKQDPLFSLSFTSQDKKITTASNYDDGLQI